MFKSNRKFSVLSLALFLIVAGGAAAAFAPRHLVNNLVGAGRPEVKVTLDGAVERGGEQLSLDKVSAVQPGEVINWNITSLNEGEGAAHQYQTIGHIPPGTQFVAGSAVAAENGSSVTYSIDGGKTFSTLPIIEEKQPDGTVKRVPAPVSMYTEVRYEWKDALASGGKVSASYKVRVK